MPESKNDDWKEEHARHWATLVPRSGQAETLQGELIRICGKLTDEAYRNGNLNWSDEHERKWRFVENHLSDASTFQDIELQEIKHAIENIIRDRTNPDLSGDGSCYYRVAEYAVRWCLAHPNAVPNPSDPSEEL